MNTPSRGEFDTLSSLIDNLKDVARLQQIVETLAISQRDITEYFAEHREQYAARGASFTELSRRLEVIERAGSDLQTRIERSAAEVLDELLKPASKLLDRIDKIEQDLAKSTESSEKLRAEFRTEIGELRGQISEKPGVGTPAPAPSPRVTHFTYGKASASVSNYLIVVFLVLATVWSLSPIGRHVLSKYLPEGAPKIEAPKSETKNKGVTP